MSFAISAYFPLGFYQGSDSGGKPEPYPSPNRLYSALVSTAYLTFGFEKHAVDSSLTDEQIHDALAWLEGNPPQEILFPRIVKAGSDAIAYRNKGYVIDAKKKNPQDKISSANASIATAYMQEPESGILLTWKWDENPSIEIARTLDSLCNEVPYLGEACSVVELQTHENYVLPYDALDSVWTLSSESALKGVSRRNRSFSVPKEGRLEDLKMAFATVNPTSKGKRKDLKVSFKEDEQNFLNEYLPLQTEGHARYNPPSSQEGSALKAPWPVAFYLEVEEIDGKCDEDGKPVWEPDESTFIGWAVALHRFLVKQWGIDPSPMLIGKYAPGIDRPANNVAIQIFDSALKNQYAHELREDISEMGPGFLIMVPRNMPQSDIQRLQNICRQVKGKTLYYTSNETTLRLGAFTTIDAEHLWRPVVEGMCRYWTPRPFAIAETRIIPDIRHGRKWKVREDVCLALGHVWRDQYVSRLSNDNREERYWDLVDAVKAKGSNFRVFDCRAVHRVNMSDYVHHANASNILRGVSALIAISDDAKSLDCAALAIGQSRHLGGGFLIPMDFSVSALKSDECFGKGASIWLK